jgi:hypothetical protein
MSSAEDRGVFRELFSLTMKGITQLNQIGRSVSASESTPQSAQSGLTGAVKKVPTKKEGFNRAGELG